jgi:hypothetical protein
LVLVLLSPVSVFLVGPIWFSFFFGASVPNFVNQFFARCRQVPLPLSLALLWSQVTREDMSSSAPAYSRPDLLLICRGPDRFLAQREPGLSHTAVFSSTGVFGLNITPFSHRLFSLILIPLRVKVCRLGLALLRRPALPVLIFPPMCHLPLQRTACSCSMSFPFLST